MNVVRCETCTTYGQWPEARWVFVQVPADKPGVAWPLHFCSWNCLIRYAERQLPQANQAWPDKSKAAIDGPKDVETPPG